MSKSAIYGKLYNKTVFGNSPNSMWMHTFQHKNSEKGITSKQLIFYYFIKLIYQDLPSCTTEIQHECLQKISLDTYNCKKSCNGLLITSFSKTEFVKNLERHIPKALNAYRKYKKMFQYNPIMEGMKHLINIVIISTFPLFYFRICVGKQVEICEDPL